MFRRLATMGIVVTAFAVSAHALDAFGPPFGANRYTTAIQSVDGVADEDDYVSSLAAGEKLTVSVAANKGSTLLPAIALIDPDGAVVTPPVVLAKAGAKITLKQFAPAKTGRWGVRVSGTNGTEGAYTIAFSVGAAPPLSLKKQHLGAADPLTVDVSFEAVAGSLVDAVVKASKTGPQVRVLAVLDPAGVGLPGATATEKPGTTTLSKFVLPATSGRFTLRLGIDSGEATYSLSLKVTPQGRPKNKKVVPLAPGEPVLEVRTSPILGVSSGRVHVTGSGFPVTPPPAVYFGLAQGEAVIVAPDGRSIDVTAPVAPDGATVSVAIVGADGQGAARDAYFHYVALPTIVDLVDASGSPVRGGSTAGGRAVRLLGTGLDVVQTVRFGSRAAPIAGAVTATGIDLLTPIGTVGANVVSVEDAFNRVVNAVFLFEYKSLPTFSLQVGPYSPAFGAVAGGTVVTISGANFEQGDRLLIDGASVATTFVSTSRRTFVSPALAAGSYSLQLVDRFDAVATGPNFMVKGAPSISTVAAVAGPRIDSANIAMGGGTTIRVTGADFAAGDVVSLGGAAGTVTSVTPTQLEFTSPAAAAGSASLTVTDALGQSSTRSNVLRYVGYEDATASRQPGGTTIDDFSALRGAVDDLDGDGRADDLIIVSDGTSPGSRSEFARIFFAANGALADQTAARFPAALGDPEGIDAWHAASVAIGDLDTSNGRDIVIAGVPTYMTTTYTYYYYGYYYYYYATTYLNEARLFTNSGTGSFSFSPLSPAVRTSAVTCTDGSGSSFDVFRPGSPGSGSARAIALGDLDGDGDDEIVTVGDHYRTGYVMILPQYVTFTPGAYVCTTASTNYSYYGYSYFAPAMRVFDNQGSSGFVDVTFPRVPLAGTLSTPQPAFHGRDVAIGDIDDDDDLDLVLTWDDPYTVTGSGMAYGSGYGYGYATPFVATRVLVNDGNGFFADQTDSWLPPAATPEYWHGSRVALADLDADDDPDLVIVCVKPVGAFLGAPDSSERALRILRNDGAATGFVDVSSSSLPTVPIAGTFDDDLRGGALRIGDVDGDGLPDILIGTNESLRAEDGTTFVRSTRLLRHGPGLTFTFDAGFLAPASVDTGEANEILLGDLAGSADPSLLILTEIPPATSPGSEFLRVQDWKR